MMLDSIEVYIRIAIVIVFGIPILPLMVFSLFDVEYEPSRFYSLILETLFKLLTVLAILGIISFVVMGVLFIFT